MLVNKEPKSKAISLGYLIKVSAGNVNASHTEGNVMVAKKVTLPDGSSLPYFSGQAQRRMLRDRLEDLGFILSEASSEVSGQEVRPPTRPWEFVDEDLFGYMDPSGGRRRTSPVRVSAAVGLFPFQGDRDLGTRSFERFGKAMQEGGNMFETELYANLFKANILVELDRVGVFTDQEVEKEKVPEEVAKIETNGRKFYVLPAEERKNRLKALLESLSLLWGGGRTARMLSDLSPRFLVYARLRVKHPVFLEALKADYQQGAFLLNADVLIGALEKFKDYLETVVFGLEAGFFGNETEVREKLRKHGQVSTVQEAVRTAKEDIEKI